MEETPVQIRAFADSRPPGRLFIVDLRRPRAAHKTTGYRIGRFRVRQMGQTGTGTPETFSDIADKRYEYGASCPSYN